MKKVFALILTLAFVCFAFAACGNGKTDLATRCDKNYIGSFLCFFSQNVTAAERVFTRAVKHRKSLTGEN